MSIGNRSHEAKKKKEVISLAKSAHCFGDLHRRIGALGSIECQG
jgi:hypothetical protein